MSSLYATSPTHVPLPVRRRLLTQYTGALATNPLRTKALTLAVSYYLQSLVSTYLASSTNVKSSTASASSFLQASPAEKVNRVTHTYKGVKRSMGEKKALMMLLYGLIVSGPMKHYLPTLIARLTAKLLPLSAASTPKKALLTQLFISLGVQAPIEVAVYVASMAYIGGARTSQQIKGALSMGFKPVYAATLVLQPLTTILCLKLVPPEFWSLVGVLVQFVIGTAAATAMKLKRARAIRDADAGKGGPKGNNTH